MHGDCLPASVLAAGKPCDTNESRSVLLRRNLYVPETVAEILDAYRTGDAPPADIVARSFARLRAHNDPALFISLREEKDVIAEAQTLVRTGDKALPLYGILTGPKDNNDLAGLPTPAPWPALV